MLLYKIVERKNPQNRQDPGKYYATPVWAGKITTEELARRISSCCTVTRHDCLGVLSAMQEHILYALKDGKSVTLDDLGTFSPSINGLGSATPEEYETNLIERVRINFLGAPGLKKAFDLKYSDLQLHKMAEQTDAADTDDEQGV